MNFLLTSQPNFRDPGGLKTADGRSVKKGLLFRSGDFSALTDPDLRTLEAMNLKTIIDFRAQREIDKHPDRIPATVSERHFFHIHDTARDMAEKHYAAKDGAALESVLTDDYVRMVHHHKHEFGEFLNVVARTENLPLVYHCAAGKDRTGLASLFLLVALGVPADEFWADYMATNDHVAGITDRIIMKINDAGEDGDMLRPLFIVRREYLQAAIDAIDSDYQGLEHYVTKVLKADTVRLRDRFLEE